MRTVQSAPAAPPEPSAAPAPAPASVLARLLAFARVDDAVERLPLLLLAVSAAAFWLLTAIWWRLDDGQIIEAEEWGLYLYGGPAALALGVATGLAVRAMGRRMRADAGPLMAGMLLAQGVTWAAVTWVLWLAPGSLTARSLTGGALVGLVLAAATGALLGARGRVGWPCAGRWLPVLAGLAALPFLGGTVNVGVALLAGVVGGALTLALSQREREPDQDVPGNVVSRPPALNQSFLRGHPSDSLAERAAPSLHPPAGVAGDAHHSSAMAEYELVETDSETNAAAPSDPLSLWERVRVRVRPLRLPPHIADGLVILLLGPVVFDPGLHFEQHSHNFFLGPVNDLLAGKTVLVDVFSQYGVLSLEALRAVFGSGVLPLSYQGLSALLSVLLVGQFAALYLLLRGTLRSEAVAGLGLLAMVAVGLFGQEGYAQFFPSTGPIRFGLFYLLMLTVMARCKRPGWRRWCLPVEAAIIGLAAIWSLETFATCAVTYVALTTYEAVTSGGGLRRVVATGLVRLAPVAVAVALAHGVLALAVHGQSGQWPQWAQYFEYVNLYMGGEFGTLPVPPWSPWPLIPAVYALSLLALLVDLLAFRARAATWPRLAVLGMSVFGVAQYSYFVGRSHPNNLYHVALPAMFLAAFWLSKLSLPRVEVPEAGRRTARACGFGALTAALVLAAPAVLHKLDASMLGGLALGPAAFAPLTHLREPAPTRPEVAETLGLLERYAPGSGRVAVFIDAELTTEVYLLSHRANVYPVSNPKQAVLLPSADWGVIAGYPTSLGAGDVVFTAPPAVLDPLQQAMLSGLCQRFEFYELARSASGIAALRLAPLGTGAVACTWGRP